MMYLLIIHFEQDLWFNESTAFWNCCRCQLKNLSQAKKKPESSVTNCIISKNFPLQFLGLNHIFPSPINIDFPCYTWSWLDQWMGNSVHFPNGIEFRKKVQGNTVWGQFNSKRTIQINHWLFCCHFCWNIWWNGKQFVDSLKQKS